MTKLIYLQIRADAWEGRSHERQEPNFQSHVLEPIRKELQKSGHIEEEVFKPFPILTLYSTDQNVGRLAVGEQGKSSSRRKRGVFQSRWVNSQIKLRKILYITISCVEPSSP